MSDEYETTEALIAEYRADADRMDAHELPQPTTQYLRIMLDRLEAALKRELSKNTSKNGADFGQLGDAAKLREALDESRRIASDLGGCRLNDYWKLNEIVRVCEAALAAPPRNCDLPEVAKDPWRAWLDDKSNWDEFGSPKLEIHDWLLAPATEKEGGAE